MSNPCLIRVSFVAKIFADNEEFDRRHAESGTEFNASAALALNLRRSTSRRGSHRSKGFFMKRYLKAISAVAVLAGGLAVFAQAPPAKKEKAVKTAPAKKEDDKRNDAQDDKDLVAFMRMKLNHSQKVLEGLVTEDFKLMADHSNQMALLVHDENWMVVETPDYRHHSADFQMVANRLTKAAREENLDGATLAYVDLMMSCVNCHKYTRGVRLAARR
jgi:hypothetical protein